MFDYQRIFIDEKGSDMRFSVVEKAPKAKIIQVVKDWKTTYLKAPYKGKECRVMQLLFDNGEMYNHYFHFRGEDKGESVWEKYWFE